MSSRLQIFQKMSGFIANSSGAAYFQFYVFKAKKNLAVNELLEDIGVKPHSIAHTILNDMKVIENFWNSKINITKLDYALNRGAPDSYCKQSTREIIGADSIDFTDDNDYFAKWEGGDLEEWWGDVSLGFLYLMGAKNNSKFIAQGVYCREY